jgi:hypothetical protein
MTHYRRNRDRILTQSCDDCRYTADETDISDDGSGAGGDYGLLCGGWGAPRDSYASAKIIGTGKYQ